LLLDLDGTVMATMTTRLPEPAAAQDIETEDREFQSVPSLLRRLSREVATLFRHELVLATTELIHALERILTGAAGVASGGAILFAGLLLMLAAAVLGLSVVIAPWLAALLVGAAVSIIGIALILGAARRLRPDSLKRPRTIRSLERDKDTIARNTR